MSSSRSLLEKRVIEALRRGWATGKATRPTSILKATKYLELNEMGMIIQSLIISKKKWICFIFSLAQ
jgi:hypothetical protein